MDRSSSSWLLQCKWSYCWRLPGLTINSSSSSLPCFCSRSCWLCTATPGCPAPSDSFEWRPPALGLFTTIHIEIQHYYYYYTNDNSIYHVLYAPSASWRWACCEEAKVLYPYVYNSIQSLSYRVATQILTLYAKPQDPTLPALMLGLDNLYIYTY